MQLELIMKKTTYDYIWQLIASVAREQSLLGL